MKFFFDNNLSPKLAAGMQAFGEDVIHLQEIFEEDTQDDIWLQHIGQNDWILITRDNRIRRCPAELAAIKNSKVGAFFLGGRHLGAWELVEQVVRNWRQMKNMAAETAKPFAFRVRANGTKLERLNL